jgi:hypothetical protein
MLAASFFYNLRFRKKRPLAVFSILWKYYSSRNTAVLIPQFLVTAKHIKVLKTMVILNYCGILKILQKYIAIKHSLNLCLCLANKYSITLVYLDSQREKKHSSFPCYNNYRFTCLTFVFVSFMYWGQLSKTFGFCRHMTC